MFIDSDHFLSVLHIYLGTYYKNQIRGLINSQLKTWRDFFMVCAEYMYANYECNNDLNNLSTETSFVPEMR